MQNFYPQSYRQYEPVTAYTITEPVVVQNQNITGSQYPPLNYQPSGSPYPVVYVPATAFQFVGANLSWNPQAQSLYVSSDYPLLREALNFLVFAYGECAHKEGKVRYNGKYQGKYVIGGQWFDFYQTEGHESPEILTSGNYYDYRTEGAAGSIYVDLTTESGKRVTFRKPTRQFSVIPWPVQPKEDS